VTWAYLASKPSGGVWWRVGDNAVPGDVDTAYSKRFATEKRKLGWACAWAR
jgi:hypothetical protein